MKKRIILFLLCLSSAILVEAQKSQGLEICAKIKDNVTQEAVRNCFVTLMLADSSVVDTVTSSVGESYQNGVSSIDSRFRFRVTKPAKYLLRIDKNGYDTRVVALNLPKLYKRETLKELPDIFMQRTRVHNIGEVTVTATKVKFYNKGDTLVYNADAFQLQEGSMLDALIKQLPGAELKSDGRIYVNGRFVENLMLNGKDFFNGNNKIMLNNLPSYTVSNIKVYERESDMSRYFGANIDDKSFVMDVNLKKQYSIGWMGNVEAGGGTAETYLARLFAMRFTPNSRITVFGNVNNVNDDNQPQQGTDWTPEKMPLGRLTVYKAGLDIRVNDRDGKFNVGSSTTFDHLRNKETANTWRTNFLTSGDTYDRIMKAVDSKNWNLFTYNSLDLRPTIAGKKVWLLFRQYFNYKKNDKDARTSAATSGSSWETFSKEQLDSLYNPSITSELRKKLINRNLSRSLGRTTYMDGEVSAGFRVGFPHSSDNVNVDASLWMQSEDYNQYARQHIGYNNNGQPTMLFLNDFSNADPTRSYRYNIDFLYNYFPLRGLELHFSYGYEQNYKTESRNLFHLAGIDGWGSGTEHELGTLPSEEAYLQTIDRSNSYNSRTLGRVHTPGVHINWWFDVNRKWQFRVNHKMYLPIQRLTLKYIGAMADTTFTRRSTQIRVYNSFISLDTKDYKHSFYLHYGLDPQTPNLRYMVRATDDADPLNVTRGGRNLKDIHYYYTKLTYDYRGRMMVSPSIYYNRTNNAVSMGYVYDKATGRRTVTPASINGNWRAGAGLSLSGALDKKRLLMFSNNLNADFVNSADYIGSDEAKPMGKSIVKTWNVSERLRLDYKIGRHSIGFSGTFSWLRSASDMAAFSTINAYNYNYGLTGMVVLPGEVNLSTDITMYSRRGYEDAGMNEDNLVWNARATKSILKGRITFAVDAFDILHQLRKVDRYVNAQGRVETYYNTVPRYVMFHAMYKFNVMPKKK